MRVCQRNVQRTGRRQIVWPYYTEAITTPVLDEKFFITVDHVIDKPLRGLQAEDDGDTIQRRDKVRSAATAHDYRLSV